MDLVRRYGNTRSGSGRDVRVDKVPPGFTIYIFVWATDNTYPHEGIAKVVELASGTFRVGWLRGTSQEPFNFSEFDDEDALYAALDRVIASR
jgi:hypothetical protein